jgi:peptide/nickel transport system substrate-binding protein
MKRCSWIQLSTALILVAVVLMFTTPAVAGKKDDTLYFSWPKELETLDRYYNTAREGMVVSRQICDDLLYRDPDTSEYKPLLAKSYKWLDNTTMEFELRQGIKFHNGEKFDADDVVYTLNFVSNPDNKVLVQRNVNWIEKAEKLGPYRVKLYLKKPFPSALEYLAGNLPIYPNEYYAKVGSKGFGIKPVGTGPYKVVEHEVGRKIVFEKNKDYFKDSPKGQPAIGRLVQRTIPEVTTMAAELITGGLDWIYLVPKDQAEKMTKFPNLQVIKAESMRVGWLVMDAAGRTGENPFQKLAVRRAVSHAIDREAISRNLAGGQSRVIHSHCFPTQFGCTDDVVKYEYDPAKAKALLAEAGYPNGFEIEMHGYRDRPYGEAIISYLQEVGIKAKLKYLKYSALREKVYGNKVTFNFTTWGSYGVNDISNITGRFYNFTEVDFARDPQVREWLKEGDSIIDPEKRKMVYKKALQRIADQAYVLPLFTWVANYVFSKELDFTPYPDAVPRFFLAKWK